MTAEELFKMADERRAAWDAMPAHQGLLANLPQEVQTTIKSLMNRREALGWEIVKELRRLNKPVRLGKRELRLTADRLAYGVVDLRTGDPEGLTLAKKDKYPSGLFYTYR